MPSKLLFGMPVVLVTSDAVIAMRRVLSALAGRAGRLAASTTASAAEKRGAIEHSGWRGPSHVLAIGPRVGGVSPMLTLRSRLPPVHLGGCPPRSVVHLVGKPSAPCGNRDDCNARGFDLPRRTRCVLPMPASGKCRGYDGTGPSMVEGAQRWRVLVAEDDALFADAVDAFLRQAGFLVVVAGDGEAALQQAAGTRFDILVTDLRMPRLDGATLIRRLRADRPDMPVIVMSGNAPEDWEHSLQRNGEGPLVLLNKPTRLQDVVKTLNALLAAPAEG